MPVLNHILVDYQNMAKVDPAIFALDRTIITLLLGRQNRTLDETQVRQLMAGSALVELIRIEKDGKNAADFALSYYLGRKSVSDPMTFFHIVSKDTGFDPLIEHLRARQLKISRHDDFKALLDVLKPKVETGREAAALKKQST